MASTSKLVDLTCTEFASALAAKEPVPGGGGAAAYVGALSAALCSMVGNFTSGKPRYAEREASIQQTLAAASASREHLLALVDADAEAFLPLSAAYAIPKDDPERAGALELATQQAAEPPLALMRELAELVKTLATMHALGSPLLRSDIGCASYLAAAALQASYLNVWVNIANYSNSSWARDIAREARALLDKTLPQAQELARQVLTSFTE